MQSAQKSFLQVSSLGLISAPMINSSNVFSTKKIYDHSEGRLK